MINVEKLKAMLLLDQIEKVGGQIVFIGEENSHD